MIVRITGGAEEDVEVGVAPRACEAVAQQITLRNHVVVLGHGVRPRQHLRPARRRVRGLTRRAGVSPREVRVDLLAFQRAATVAPHIGLRIFRDLGRRRLRLVPLAPSVQADVHRVDLRPRGDGLLVGGEGHQRVAACLQVRDRLLHRAANSRTRRWVHVAVLAVQVVADAQGRAWAVEGVVEGHGRHAVELEQRGARRPQGLAHVNQVLDVAAHRATRRRDSVCGDTHGDQTCLAKQSWRCSHSLPGGS